MSDQAQIERLNMGRKHVETRMLGEIEAKSLLFEHEGRKYLWGEGETSDVVGPASLVDVNLDWGSGNFYLFAIADCAFPPLFVVQHSSFENAYEEFIDWKTDALKIDERDLPDYRDDFMTNSNGVPVDTECVQGFEVKLIEAKFA
jgi:hypothetical protein